MVVAMNGMPGVSMSRAEKVAAAIRARKATIENLDAVLFLDVDGVCMRMAFDCHNINSAHPAWDFSGTCWTERVQPSFYRVHGGSKLQQDLKYPSTAKHGLPHLCLCDQAIKRTAQFRTAREKYWNGWRATSPKLGSQ